MAMYTNVYILAHDQTNIIDSMMYNPHIMIVS